MNRLTKGHSPPRLTPDPCPKCGYLARRPMACVAAVANMSTGIGGLRGYTAIDMAQLLGISRQAAWVAICDAVSRGLAEMVPGTKGRYRKTKYGRVLVQIWRQAGWTGRTKRGIPQGGGGVPRSSRGRR